MKKTLYEKFLKKLYHVKRLKNFRELVYDSAKKYGSRHAFQLKRSDGSFEYITYRRLKADYRAAGTAFINSGFSGARMAVIGKNSYAWTLGYLAASTVGVAVPIDKELCAEDIYSFIKSSESEVVMADDNIIEKLKPLCGDSVHWFSLQNFNFPAAPKEKDALIDIMPIDENAMKVLIFTSGTTGKSKGVCLSHKNICSDIYSTVRMVKITCSDKTLSILPLHHTYECTLDCLLVLSRGGCISYFEGLTKILQNISEYHPSVVVVVPALLEMMSKRIKRSVAGGCPQKYKSLFETLSFGEAMEKIPFIIRYLIRQKVKKTLGGKLRMFIVGAADLSPSIVEDFAALGIKTLQGYGLTECSPLLAGNNDFYLNPKSTGIAIPGVELKIDNPNEAGVGEIIARGDNIMLGYYRDEAETAKVMRGGYFHTGDLGRMDENGYLYIMGRLKNIIVTSNGKNIYPEEIETRLAESDCVSESLVLPGTDRNGEICVKAKILPNLDRIKEILGHLPSEEEINAAIKNVIDIINSKLPGYKHIRIIEIMTKELEKTTTRKIRRCGSNLA